METMCADLYKVGEFDVDQGWICVVDPESVFAPGSQLFLMGLKKGTWQARITGERKGTGASVRIHELSAYHESIDDLDQLFWDFVMTIRTNSGQIGVIASEQFLPDSDEWRFQVNLTIDTGEFRTGIMPGGVVSEVCQGNGSCNVYKAYDRTMVTAAIRLIFAGG
jgi:hypothetical protein